MKSSFFLLALHLVAFSTWAQPSYEVVEAPHWLNNKFTPAYTINLIGSTPDGVAQAWAAVLLKSGGKSIEKLDNQVYRCQQVTFPSVSQEPFDVYFQTYGNGAPSAYLTVWLKQGDQFLSTNSQPASFRPLSRLLLQFSFDQEDQLKADIRKEEDNRSDELFLGHPAGNGKGN